MNPQRLHYLGNTSTYPGGAVSSSSSVKVTTVRSGGSSPVVSSLRYPVQPSRLAWQTHGVMPTTHYTTTPHTYIPPTANITVPGISSVPTTRSSAKMGIAQTWEQPEKHKVATVPQLTYRISSAINLGHIRCEGVLGLADDLIVEALNVYVGVAPFHLTAENLEITPQEVVIPREPNIRFLLENLDGETVTLAQLKQMSGLQPSEEMWLGLPGQAASLFMPAEQDNNNAEKNPSKVTQAEGECSAGPTTVAS